MVYKCLKQAILCVLLGLYEKIRRVIKYKENGKVNALKEQVFTRGYAVQFDDVADYVMNLIPQEEINS